MVVQSQEHLSAPCMSKMYDVRAQGKSHNVYWNLLEYRNDCLIPLSIVGFITVELNVIQDNLLAPCDTTVKSFWNLARA